jgi:hypothetical protein
LIDDRDDEDDDVVVVDDDDDEDDDDDGVPAVLEMDTAFVTVVLTPQYQITEIRPVVERNGSGDGGGANITNRTAVTPAASSNSQRVFPSQMHPFWNPPRQ